MFKMKKFVFGFLLPMLLVPGLVGAQDFGTQITARNEVSGGGSAIYSGNIWYYGINTTATNLSGGAYFARSGFNSNRTVTFSGNTKFENNNAGAAGGAIGLNNSDLTSMVEASFAGVYTQFLNNHSGDYGGAIFIGNKGSGTPDQAARVTLNIGTSGSRTNLTATGNSSSNGGFLYNFGGLINLYTVDGSVISSNTASGSGGAFYFNTASSNNSSNSLYFNPQGTLTISNNTASDLGGAIFMGPRNGNFISGYTHTHVTFAGDGTVNMVGNSDGSGANDIYMMDYAVVDITGSGNYLLNGGIASVVSNDVEVNHSGTGYFLADMRRFRGVYTQTNGSSKINGDLINSTYSIGVSGTADFGGTSSATITNAGTAYFSGIGKTIAGTLTGAGTTIITGSITNATNITQNALKVATGGTFYTSFANTANIVSANIINRGTLQYTSAGTLNKNITNIDVAPNTGGNLIINTNINNNNSRTVRQDYITVNNGATFTSNAGLLEALQSIENSGSLILTGGTNANIINTNNYLQITGAVTNTGSIYNTGSGVIDVDAILTNTGLISTNADNFDLTNVGNTFDNEGTLIFTGGTNDDTITGVGQTIITGGSLASPVTTTADITQTSFTVTNTGYFETVADRLVMSDKIVNEGNLTFTSGTNGNAINNSGTLTMLGDVASSGNVYNEAAMFLSAAAGSTITLNNTLLSEGEDIYQTAAGTITIDGDGDVIVSSGIAGSGTINKTAGNLYLAGANDGYAGVYNQTDGYTEVTGSYFVGTSSITGGVLELADGSSLNGGVIELWDIGASTGTLLISANNDLSYSGQFIGNGIINKTSDSLLTLSGDSSLFSGTYNQTAGTTAVTATGVMFDGTNNIIDSLLQITGDGIYYTVNLGNNGILEHYNTTPGSAMINGSSIMFTGSGASAVFGKDAGLSENAKYILASKIENGSANEVEFNNSNVYFDIYDYTGETTYSFNNSVIDITANPATSTRTVTFDNFKSSNTSLDFALKFYDDGSDIALDSDKLTVNVTSESDGLLLGNVKILNDDRDNGLNGTYATTVLSGIQFQSGQEMALATTVYEYLANVDNGQTGINLSVVKEADEYSLNAMNVYYGNRGFNFSFFEGTPDVYNIGTSLDVMSAGTFVVQGFDSDATHSVISGELEGNSGTYGSLFQMENATNLTIKNLTIEDASVSGDGSALNITNAAAAATLSNLIIRNNESTDNGGAIYNLNGEVNIGNAVFSGNIAGGDGGAIYNAGIITLTSDSGDIVFENNTANGAANDIYNDGTLNISGSLNDVIINGGISGTGDIEKSGSGRLLINGDSSLFTGTMNQTGGLVLVTDAFFAGTSNVSNGTIELAQGSSLTSGSVIALADMGQLNITTNDNITLEDGQIKGYDGGSGTDYGTINKSGSGTLNVGYDYSGFLGTFMQAKGNTVVTSDFFGGDNIVAGGTLSFEDGGTITSAVQLGAEGIIEFDQTGNYTLGANDITGYNGTYGTINKKNDGTLNIAGNNSGFMGTFNIQAGVVSPVNDVNLTFGKFVIEDGGKYSTVTGNADQTTAVGDALIAGELDIDVDLDTLTADKITAVAGLKTGASGTVEIQGTSSLNLNIVGSRPFDMIGMYAITLAEGNGGVTGEFGNYPSNSILPGYEIRYFSDRVDFMFGKSSNFLNNIAKLTHNQTEVARAFDALSTYVATGEMIAMLNQIDTMANDTLKKAALDQLSGAFLANALTLGAVRNGAEELYYRIKPRICEGDGLISRSIWGQVYANGIKYSEDIESINDFTSAGYGAQIGADLLRGENALGGVYAGYGMNKLEQGKDNADMNDANVGVYGAWFGNVINVKGSLTGGMQNYETEREITFAGYKTKAEFNTYSVRADAQAEYIIGITENLNLKPFIGVQSGYVMNDKIEEKDGGPANLVVDAGSYMRLVGLAGLGISGDIGEEKRFNWQARAYAGYIAVGAKPEFDGYFKEYADEEINIWGADEKEIYGGLGLGGEYLISKKLSVYANVNAEMGENMSGYYGNLGVNYRFCGDGAKTAKKKGKKEKELDMQQALLDAAEANRIEEAMKREEAAMQAEQAKLEQAKLEAERQAAMAQDMNEAILEQKKKEAEARRSKPVIKSFSLSAATFASGKYDLGEKAKGDVAGMAEEIKKYEYKQITIEGHTDSTGSDALNKTLSRKRAEAVYHEFIANGIPADKMEYVGFSSRMPVKSNSTPAGRSANRRTEVYVE